MNYRKQQTVTITVSNMELDKMEDYLMCVPLCNRHKRLYTNEDAENLWQTCRRCKAVHDDWKKSAMKILSRLYRVLEAGQ